MTTRSFSRRQVGLLALAVFAGVLLLALAYARFARGDDSALPDLPIAIPTINPSLPATLVGAGDIATCATEHDTATAKLVRGIPGIVFVLGDNAYDNGTRAEYARCFGPTWGEFRERTRPVPGNHEYGTRGAAGYFEYFGAAAGTPGEGWYAYDVGSWRVYALNSNCSAVGGCDRSSRQVRWLAADLAANPRQCVLAYWHHPLFSSGYHDDSPFMKDTWEVLHAAGAEIVVNGHDHNYERFAPQSPDGRRDDERGIRQFVAGTGGGVLRPFEEKDPNSEVRKAGTYGVLALTLKDGGYDWRFVPVPGSSFSDFGSGRCH